MARLPGDAPTGSTFAVSLGMLALVTGAGLLITLAAAGSFPQPAVSLIPPLSVAFVGARLLAFDPYFLPSLRRFADGGLIRRPWVAILAGLAMIAGILVWSAPRSGQVATALVMLLCAATVFLSGVGH